MLYIIFLVLIPVLPHLPSPPTEASTSLAPAAIASGIPAATTFLALLLEKVLRARKNRHLLRAQLSSLQR